MKVLFSARPAYGHVYPMIPLATAARAAGHHVAFATAGMFVAKLAALGFPTFDVGLSIEDAIAEAGASSPDIPERETAPGRPLPEVGVRIFFDILAPATAADMPAVLASFTPDLVIYEQYDLGAAIAAHAADIPAICHSVSPHAVTRTAENLAADAIARLWDNAGRTGATFDVFTGDQYLDIVPDIIQAPSFHQHPKRRPIKPIGYSEPGGTVPPWLDQTERPTVYLTLGTFSASDAALAIAITGLARLDVEVIVALGSAAGDALGPTPPHVHLERFVDQANLIPRVDLVVHHGGSGTMLAALANGTPQLVMPQGADQFFNADALVAADLAAAIEPAQLTAETVADLAQQALRTPRAATQQARHEIAEMTPPALVIEQLAAQYGADHDLSFV